MILTKCDACGVLSDRREPFALDWRSISVRRARDGHTEWSPAFVNVKGIPGLVESAPDTWPGYERWTNHYGSYSPLELHFCSEACLLDGMRKLHKGARIVGFEGFSLRAEALSASLVVTAELASAGAASNDD